MAVPNDGLYYTREWLNEPGHHAGGYIIAYLDQEGFGELILQDCYRQISLDVGVMANDAKVRENQIAKVAKLHRISGELLRAMQREDRRRTRLAERAAARASSE